MPCLNGVSGCAYFWETAVKTRLAKHVVRRLLRGPLRFARLTALRSAAVPGLGFGTRRRLLSDYKDCVLACTGINISHF